NGDVLTGEQKSKDGFLGFYHNMFTAIPEGDDYDFFGWNIPRPNKFSVYRANMFSFLTPNKKYDLNTNTNGEHRAFVLTGDYEKVFPLDIYPIQLLKSILVNDIDQMEALGIYEVAPEDFALTEYICVSKQDHQRIVRHGLDVMIKEVG
ncbi:MAG: NADH:ubiquinone reductase (Na(+)-transporting) subunit A, partial [Flavobacterium sp.]